MTSFDRLREMTPAQQFADRARHIVLPVITMTYAQLAVFARFTKSAVTEVIRQDFIVAARAKGVRDGRACCGVTRSATRSCRSSRCSASPSRT